MGKLILAKDLSFDDYSLKRDGVSQSMLTTYGHCDMAFLYSVNGFTLPGKTKMTGFGSLFHYVMDRIYKYAMKYGEPPEPERIGRYVERFVEKYPDQMMAKKDREIKMDMVICHVLACAYVEHYEADFTQKRFKMLEEEFNGIYKGVRLRGKIDAVYKCDGRWWLMEHKTKGRITPGPLLQSLSFDRQLHFYTLALREFYDIEIFGALYNLVRYPQIRSKSTTPSEARRKLTREVGRNPGYYFLRMEVPLHKKEKRRFERDLAEEISSLRELVRGERRCKRNRSACLRGFTNCEFLSACSEGSMDAYVRKERLFTELSEGREHGKKRR